MDIDHPPEPSIIQVVDVTETSNIKPQNLQILHLIYIDTCKRQKAKSGPQIVGSKIEISVSIEIES